MSVPMQARPAAPDYVDFVHRQQRRRKRGAWRRHFMSTAAHAWRRHRSTIAYVAYEALCGLAFVVFLASVFGLFILASV